MGHFFKEAVEVIGVAVAIAAAIPSGGTSLLAATLGATGASAAEIGVGGLAAISALTAQKPIPIATPTVWQSDPEAGIPHVGGRTFRLATLVLRERDDDSYGPDRTIIGRDLDNRRGILPRRWRDT